MARQECDYYEPEIKFATVTNSVSIANNTTGSVSLSIPSGGTKILGFIPLVLGVLGEVWSLNQRINSISIGTTSVSVQVYQYNGATKTIVVQGMIIYI